MTTATHEQVLAVRTMAQRLHPLTRRADSVARVVAAVCGLQAQDALAAQLGVRARSVGLCAADVERARVDERLVVQTWCWRGTLHLVASDDLAWLLPLVGPVFIRANRRRYAELGLDEDTIGRGLRAVQDVLARCGPLTRPEITDLLAARGIRLEGQARPHLLGRAALEGLICLGPDRGREPTYALLADWLGKLRVASRAEALRTLASRYLAAYGPAGPEDLAAWSGLPAVDVRTAWAHVGEVDLVRVGSRETWLPRSRLEWLHQAQTADAVVRLLGAFDTYLLGYRDRALAVAPAHLRRVHPGGGIIHPVVLVDGRAMGRWRFHPGTSSSEVQVDPFVPLASAIQDGIVAETADLARFLGHGAPRRPEREGGSPTARSDTAPGAGGPADR